MKPRTLLFLPGILLLWSCDMATEPGLVYPEVHTVEQADDYHGTLVTDPYRWLEDLDSEETRQWVEAQNGVTFSYLESIPQRQAIKDRLTELWNYEKFGIPRKYGSRYFFTRNDGLQNQSVLYFTESLDAEPRVLLDPNQLSTDGTVALTGWQVSPDGKYLAYGTASGGSDWQEWKVRDIDSSEDLSDHIRRVKFSGAAWSADSQGFYYGRYLEPQGNELEELNYFQKVYYHKIADPQDEDTLVYERPDQKEWLFGSIVTDDGRYLILNVSQGTDTRNRVFYRDLKPDSKFVELLNDFDARYDFVGNDGSRFFFVTDLDAPKGRLIEIDTAKPARDRWREIIPQAETTLEGVSYLNRTFIASYLRDARSEVILLDRDGKLVKTLELPGMGSVGGFSGRDTDTETFYIFTSFTDPGSIFHLDLTSGEARLFRRADLKFDPNQYETRQVFYTSKDGTRIPMFITGRKGLEQNGDLPTLLYAYGGFNISVTPSFSVFNLSWMEMGGVYAVPNLRGGGEYGEEWHQGGMKLNKQNVFDDFIAAAEWLIANNYTNKSKIAIRGGSNGGLLVGACMTQRPDLFGATLPAVGVMDMLRFNKFTIGWAWVSDYGSPENPEEFNALFAYSPYHNIKAGTAYPPTLVTTADHDDRVVPSHSFKFISALQAAHTGPNPVLIRIETRAGHGAGKPTTKQIEEAADSIAFLVKNLGVAME